MCLRICVCGVGCSLSFEGDAAMMRTFFSFLQEKGSIRAERSSKRMGTVEFHEPLRAGSVRFCSLNLFVVSPVPPCLSVCGMKGIAIFGTTTSTPQLSFRTVVGHGEFM